MKNKKKTFIAILTSFIAIAVLVGGYYTYTNFIGYETVDFFKYIEYTEHGADGDGKIIPKLAINLNDHVFEVKREKQDEIDLLRSLQNELVIDVENNEKLTTGDEVTVNIKANQDVLKRNKIRPETTKSTHKVKRLVDVKSTWQEYTNMEPLKTHMDELLVKFKESYEEYQNNNTQEKFGVDAKTTISYELAHVEYGVKPLGEDEFCSIVAQNYQSIYLEPIASCGNAIFLYRMDKTIEEPMYFPEPVEYIYFYVRNIYEKDNKLYFEKIELFPDDVYIHVYEDTRVLGTNPEMVDVPLEDVWAKA